MKRSLREILSEMDNKERAKYIWEYYKFFIIGFIILILLIVYTISSVINKKEDFLNIVMMGGFVDHQQVEIVESTLFDALLEEDEKEKSLIRIQNLRTAGSGNDVDMQAGIDIQKMAAELSAGMINVFIVPEEFFNEMNDDDQLTPLNELLGQSSLPFSDDELYFAPDGTTPTGIDLSAVKLFDGMSLDEEEKIICVPLNSQNKENTTRFIQYIVSEKNEG